MLITISAHRYNTRLDEDSNTASSLFNDILKSFNKTQDVEIFGEGRFARLDVTEDQYQEMQKIGSGVLNILKERSIKPF
ncbi:hypothetical protein BKI51_02445 [Alphaproteobacteria bacterium AO1-B]|nr:hypothetical protein BKI51_02445 [Alphaproteobacteria bacterium AO1-B]